MSQQAYSPGLSHPASPELASCCDTLDLGSQGCNWAEDGCPSVPDAPITTAPTGLEIDDGSQASEVDLSWANHDEPGATEIWKSTNGTTFTLFATLGPGEDGTFDEGGLPDNTIWYYKIRAAKDGINSEFSNTVSAGNNLDKHGASDASLSYPNLLMVFGYFYAYSMPNLTSFSAPLLRRVDLDFQLNDCPLLTSVNLLALATSGELPDNSGNLFFDNCTSLTTLNLPALTRQGGGGGNFHVNGCTLLTSLNLPVLISQGGDFLVNNCTALTTLSCPSLTNVAESLDFHGCTSLTSALFPVLAGTGTGLVFDGCTALTSITFPAFVEVDGDISGSGCTHLASLGFPVLYGPSMSDSNPKVSAMTFNGCTLLTTLTMPLAVFLNGGSLNFQSCALTAASVNLVLARAKASSPALTTETIQLNLGTNAAPTGQGIVDKAFLITAGNTVTTN